MNKDVLEGNKLIAEFMAEEPEVLKRDLKRAGTLESMQFHKSWDWLMPIVEKIDSIIPDDSFVTIEYNRCLITVLDGGFDIDVIGNSRIEATYKAVVEFIKWYNSNN